MGVTRITIFAGKFASAIWIDRPGKWHLAAADAAVQNRARGQREIFDFMSLANTVTVRGEASDAHETRTRIRDERQRGWHCIRRLFAIIASAISRHKNPN